MILETPNASVLFLRLRIYMKYKYGGPITIFLEDSFQGKRRINFYKVKQSFSLFQLRMHHGNIIASEAMSLLLCITIFFHHSAKRQMKKLHQVRKITSFRTFIDMIHVTWILQIYIESATNM